MSGDPVSRHATIRRVGRDVTEIDAEEIGELAQAVRKGTREQQLHEFGDVIAWVASLANQMGISLEEAAARYASGCPVCSSLPCEC